MGLRDLNIDLTKEHVALWDSAKKFMREVWRPAAVELDRLVNPEDVYAEGSVLWDVFRLKLFDMFASVEAARSLARRVLVYNTNLYKQMQPMAIHYTMAAFKIPSIVLV